MLEVLVAPSECDSLNVSVSVGDVVSWGDEVFPAAAEDCWRIFCLPAERLRCWWVRGLLVVVAVGEAEVNVTE